MKKSIIVSGVILWYSLILLVVPLILNLYDKCYPIKNICYPSESMFYPFPLIAIVILSSGMAFAGYIIRFLGLSYLRLRDSSKQFDKLIPVISLFVSIIAIFSPFLLTFPLLGYDVELDDTNNQVSVLIKNIGVVSARDVVVSINSNNENITFNNILIEPILPVIHNETNGDIFFNLERISPFSSVTIKAHLSNFDNINNVLTTHITSEQWVGYSNLEKIIIFALAAFILPFAYLLERATGIFSKMITDNGKTNVQGSVSATPSLPQHPSSPPTPPSSPPPQPQRPPAEAEEEKAQRRKKLAREIKRIDAATNSLTDNGLFDKRSTRPFGKNVGEEKEQTEMDEAFREIQANLYMARKSLDNDDLADSNYYVVQSLKAYDKALYTPSRMWRFSNVYAGFMWIYLIGFLVAVLAFYSLQLDTNILGIYLPGVSIQETALHATIWGTVGAILRGLWFLKDKVSDRRYRNSYRSYLLSSPFLGGLFGAIFYFLIVSALFIIAPAQAPEILANQTISEPNATATPTTSTGSENQANGTSERNVSTLAIIPLAALAGFNWEWAVMILKRIGESFKGETEADDKIET